MSRCAETEMNVIGFYNVNGLFIGIFSSQWGMSERCRYICYCVAASDMRGISSRNCRVSFLSRLMSRYYCPAVCNQSELSPIWLSGDSWWIFEEVVQKNSKEWQMMIIRETRKWLIVFLFTFSSSFSSFFLNLSMHVAENVLSLD